MKLYDRQEKTDWMKDGKYGVFYHYLFSLEEMEQFDAVKFADNVESTGAAWAVITLGQNSGFYCAPNPTYERLTGNAPGSKCSPLDIPMQAAKELAKRNIRMMLYLPSHAPSNDNEASKKLGVDQKIRSDWEMNETIVKNWTEIVKDWSIHYGKTCSGWWFDGFYPWIKLHAHWAKFYKEAVMAGNEDTILALNHGVEDIIYPANKYCDYTPGELNDFGVLPEERFVDESQWHVLSFLGTNWCAADVKYDANYMTDYIRKVNEKEGVVTVEMHINPDGSMSEEQLAVMREVKKNLR